MEQGNVSIAVAMARAVGFIVAAALLIPHTGEIAWSYRGVLVAATITIPTSTVSLAAFLFKLCAPGTNPLTVMSAMTSTLPGQSLSWLFWLPIAAGMFAGSCCWWPFPGRGTADLPDRATTSVQRATGVTQFGVTPAAGSSGFWFPPSLERTFRPMASRVIYYVSYCRAKRG